MDSLPNTMKWLMLLFALLAFSHIGMAQTSIRLGTSCDGASQPACGGSASFVLGDSTRSVSTVTTRYLDGQVHQTFSTGAERDLFHTALADFFTCGTVGLEVAGDNKGGVFSGCVGIKSKPLLDKDSFSLRLVGTGTGSNATLQDGTWNGGFSAGLQIDLKTPKP